MTVRPGLVYVFRDDAERMALLARRLGGERFDHPGGETVARIVALLHARGRRPDPEEAPGLWSDAARG